MTNGGSTPRTPLAMPVSCTDLIDTARTLLGPLPPATQPTDAAIRRAVSTAY